MSTYSRIAIVVGWVVVFIGIGLVGTAAAFAGRPTSWSENLIALVVWAPGIAAVTESARGLRRGLLWSFAGVGSLLTVAIIDRATRPVASNWEFALAFAAALTTVAGLVLAGPRPAST